jgi:hypothetical protein
MNNKKDLDSKENLGHGIKGELDDTAKLKSSKNSTKNNSKNEKSNMDELL